MAKKTKLSFTDLDNKLTKISPDGSIVTKNSFSKVDEFISTGNYMLNAMFSGSLFGGFPNCRSVELAGASGTGKTFLALNACREAQKKGYEVIYCDSEAAVDQEVFEKFGIDPNRIRYQPVNTIQDFTMFVNQLLEMLEEAKEEKQEIPKIMLVLDSIGNLASTKEKEDAKTGSKTRDMTKQQVIRSMFRTTTIDLAAHKIPFIIINHVYQSMSMFGGNNNIAGGGGVIYNPSIIAMLTAAKPKDDKKETKEDIKKAKDAEMGQTGVVVSAWPKKNRFAKPIPVKLHISFFRGMNKYTGLEKHISWDNCGIDRGNLVSKTEWEKWVKSQKQSTDEKENIYYEKYRWEGEDKNGKTKTFYFVPKETARKYAVKHLNDEIALSELFTPTVLPDNILRELDEKVIKPLFMLPDISNLDDLAEIEMEDYGSKADEASEEDDE